MGNKPQQYSPIDSFNPEQWEEVPLSEDQKQYGDNYKKFKHRITNEIIQKYEFVFNDEQQYREYLESFNWRLNQQCIVNTKFLREKHSKDFCSTTYVADVYTQNIRMRLSEVTDIPYPENLYVLYSTLEGYSKIYHFLGYMRPKEKLICVDSDGYVRVWINSDLSKNYPQEDDLVETKDRMTQSMMVNEIISMISQNTDHDSEPMSLPEYFQTKNKLHPTFDQAKLLIRQYSRQYRTPIPDCFESVLQMLNHDQQADYQPEKQKQHKHHIFSRQQASNSKTQLQMEPNQNYIQKPPLTDQKHVSPYHQIVSNNGLTNIYNNKHKKLKHSQQISELLNAPNRSHQIERNYHNISSIRGPVHSIKFNVPMNNQINSFDRGHPQMVISQPGRPQSNMQMDRVPIQRQFVDRSFSSRDNYARSLPLQSQFLRTYRYTNNPSMHSSSIRLDPIRNTWTYSNVKPRIQIKFLNNLAQNRQMILGNGLETYPPPHSVPVRVSRTNFAKSIHQNIINQIPQNKQLNKREENLQNQQGRRQKNEPFIRYLHEAQHQREQTNNLSEQRENRIVIPQNLSLRAKPMVTRQQTLRNFNGLGALTNKKQSFGDYESKDYNSLQRVQEQEIHIPKVRGEPNYRQKVGQLQANNGKQNIKFQQITQKDAGQNRRERELQRSRQKSIEIDLSGSVQKSVKRREEKHYYTSNTDQLLDPQIAADLALYANLGEL